jgi:hypothetical protein
MPSNNAFLAIGDVSIIVNVVRVRTVNLVCEREASHSQRGRDAQDGFMYLFRAHQRPMFDSHGRQPCVLASVVSYRQAKPK